MKAAVPSAAPLIKSRRFILFLVISIPLERRLTAPIVRLPARLSWFQSKRLTILRFRSGFRLRAPARLSPHSRPQNASTDPSTSLRSAQDFASGLPLGLRLTHARNTPQLSPRAPSYS